MTEDPRGANRGEPEIRAFLIADVRGYTRFTQQHGDEAAARLAARFADIARGAVSTGGGTLVELRGDEALAVFSSSRAAIRAALQLQDRFVEATEEDPTTPLRVGIGLDAGEAVAVEGGYRGGALNLAARLCSRAGPGQVLASDGIVHLAGLVPGIRLVALKELRLKGLATPVRAFRVLPDGPDPADRLAAVAPPEPAPRPRAGPRRPGPDRGLILAGAVVSAVAILVLLVFGLSRLGRSGERGGPPASSPSSAAGPVPAGLLRIDVATGKVASEVPIDQAERVVLDDRFVWVETSDGSVVKVNPASNTAVATIRGIVIVTGGPGGLWGRADDGPLRFLDNRTNRVRAISGTDSIGVSALSFGAGSVWVANVFSSTVTRLDPVTGRADRGFRENPGPGEAVCPACNLMAVGGGAVWFQNTEGSVSRLDLSSLRSTVVAVPPVETMVADQSFLWTLSRDGTLEQVSPDGHTVLQRKQLASGATSLAVGDGTVWVGNEADRTVTSYDESSLQPGRRIRLSVVPEALAVGGGSVWVAHP